MERLDIYTGTLNYKNIEFSFVFDKKELRLIPPAEKTSEVRYSILMKKIGDGPAYTMASPTMDEPYLVGKSHESGQTLIFLTKQGAHIGSYNEVLFVEVAAYILCKMDSHPISKMSLTCPELDCIYPVTQGFSCKLNHEEFQKNGVLSVTTEDFDATTTSPKTFSVDGKEVEVTFCISRSFSTKVGQPPLSLHSTMVFRFDPTEDYSFIVRLWFVAKEFLQFLCYRRNVFIPVADLSTPADEGKTRAFAKLNWLEEYGDEEFETLEKGRFIKLPYLAGNEGKILNDIAAKTLYTRHIPDTYTSGCRINAARFVMITAAFEWEFSRTFSDGIPKDEEELSIEATVLEAIQSLIDSNTGALKKRYKDIRYHIKKSDTLEKKIIHAGINFDSIISIFGKRLYALNDSELIYNEMGKRLSAQRNHYAHGDLDMDFIDESLLDLIYTERIVYAMQLKYYGLAEKDIQNAINELFRCGLLIR